MQLAESLAVLQKFPSVVSSQATSAEVIPLKLERLKQNVKLKVV